MQLDTIYQYNFPTTIRFGAGASGELADYLLAQNLSRPLIVTDPTVAQLDFFSSIINQLEKKNISTGIFSDIHKNPVKSDVYKGTEAYDSTHRNAIIGIGGGAAIDVARAIVLRVYHREDLFKYDDLIGGRCICNK
jgi:alcohol dehydrogenase class IV